MARTSKSPVGKTRTYLNANGFSEAVPETKHHGHEVYVVRQLNRREADAEVGPMFEVRCQTDDEFFDVFAEEVAERSDLDKHMALYAPADRPVTVIEVPEGDLGRNPFVVLKYGQYTMILNPMGLGNHLCLDVYPFVDGAKATAGAFGMTNGRRLAFEGSKTTSFGWDSASMVAVLLGEQKEKEGDNK